MDILKKAKETLKGQTNRRDQVALKVTNENFYILSAIYGNKVPPVNDILNEFFVVDPELPKGYGWFDDLYFHRFYRWLDGGNPKGWAPITRQRDDEA